MKILFFAQAALRKELGGPKVVLELAEAIEELGHHTEVLGPHEVENLLKKKGLSFNSYYADNINTLLKEIGDDYDVVDVDGNHLYKTEVANLKNTLFVARSVLFIPHLSHIKWPVKKTVKNHLGALLKYLKGQGNSQKRKISRYYESLNRADIISVSNHEDVRQLLEDGYGSEKIFEAPYALNSEKKRDLRKINSISKNGNEIVFLGTFDFRKGCLDLVKAFIEVKKQVPDANLTLLGCKGLFKEKEEILRFFPKSIRSSVKIIPTFKAHDLPKLLKKIKLAMFTSYFEGFPFSIIECITAGIPVIAFNSPGASSSLPETYLVEPGDWRSMAHKVVYLLENSKELAGSQREIIEHAEKYDWHIIAQETLEVYREQLTLKIEAHKEEARLGRAKTLFEL
ncbi:glycosyltransferase family 4 protein [Zunongwangia sp. F260]|uniref:Glycosyltransferase family 4 protein n=1 Tax=Autumnicola lenta TaxID=3075593 RepID=A0ABU3CIS3_9FLAO|nr:glycosyltransferase family 4 protein [Zunongwangia sp. F260]MDT0646262.1 glycosyltransferase family 4 protein [Zunongwangia sp. F260]